MNIAVWFDGACEPKNPGGVATSGWVIESHGETLEEGHRVVASGPSATNNVAEYCALGLALKSLLASGAVAQEHVTTLSIYGDSKLVIEQINGNWQCKRAHLRKLRDRCLEILKQLGVEWEATWVPREQNERADALSQVAYEQFTGKRFPKRVRHNA